MSEVITTASTAKKTTKAPTSEELVARARALIPLLRERARADEVARKVNPDTVRRMNEAGLFRVLQSKKWGGYELGPRTFAEVQIALAEGDMSVAWIYGVLGVHNLHICLMNDRAAQDVWGEDTSVLISSPYMPTGVAKRVPGGFELTGRWGYSSGCDHCSWTFLGGVVEGDPNDFRAFLLERKDAKILDTWDTLGLSATGSQDIVAEKVFVPEHRTHKFRDGFQVTNPGASVNSGPLYRIPFQLIFMRAITNSQIGALQHLLDLVKAYIKDKVSFGRKMAEDAEARLAIVEATAGIAEMKHTAFANFATMEAYANRNELPPLEMRHQLRFHSARVAERCIRLAEQLIQATGGGAVYNRTGMGAIYRDMLTGRQHIAAQYRNYGRVYCELLLGGTSDDIFL